MNKTSLDVGIGLQATTLPLWALQSQDWFIWAAAVAGGLLALGRLGFFLVETAQKLRGGADDGE